MSATRLFSRALVRVAAATPDEDPVGFLQGLLTSDVAGALPVWTGLLTPQGKALFDMIAWPGTAAAGGEHGDGALLLDCESDAADALVRRLSLYRLRRRLTIARDDSLAVHWRADAGAPPASADPRLAALGARWLAAADPADAAADDAWRAHRLRLGVVEGRAELGDGETLWLEANAAELGGVSFAKGCYVGQENTARMNWRQKVNRRLLVVPLARSDPARRRVAYPPLGLAIDHLRVADLDPALLPTWLAPAAHGGGEPPTPG